MSVVTQHPEPSDLVHEQRRDDVPGQDGQSSQKTDKVDHVGVVLVADVAEHAALFVVQESAVDQSAVDQSVLKKVWSNVTGEGGGGEEEEEDGGREDKRRVWSEKLLVQNVASCFALLRPNLIIDTWGGSWTFF